MNTASAKGQPARTPFPWVTIPIAQAAALNYLDPCPFGNRSLKAHDVAIAPTSRWIPASIRYRAARLLGAIPGVSTRAQYIGL